MLGKRAAGIWLFCFLPAVLCAGQAAAGPASMQPVEEPRGEVVLPSGRVLQVEIADTPAKRARGYMSRERISDTEGMVFMMERLDFHSFWMKNCKVGLDIIWLDENWKAVHIERKVPACLKDPCPSYTPLQASLYVLELQEGLSQKEGIKLGDRILYRPPQ